MEFKKGTDSLYLEDETGRQIALIQFPEIRPDVVNIVHTEVDPSMGGQGIAGKITQKTAEYLREMNKKAVLSCSYSIKWFASHPEYQDILDDPDEEAEKAQILAGPACGINQKRN